MRLPKGRAEEPSISIRLCPAKTQQGAKTSRVFEFAASSIAGMHKLARWIVSMVGRRLRSRAAPELENLALRHQLHVLRRQRPVAPVLFAIDRLLWIWLYRIWPRCLEAMVLVKPATVVQWHRQGFRLFCRWRSKSGRPSVDREILARVTLRATTGEHLVVSFFRREHTRESGPVLAEL